MEANSEVKSEVVKLLERKTNGEEVIDLVKVIKQEGPVVTIVSHKNNRGREMKMIDLDDDGVYSIYSQDPMTGADCGVRRGPTFQFT